MARRTLYRRYTDEFKAQAVKLSLHPDILIKDVAAALDIHPFMLSRWRKQYREGKIVADKRKKAPLPKIKPAEIKRISELERKLKELEIENDLLKKTIQFNLEKRKKSSKS